MRRFYGLVDGGQKRKVRFQLLAILTNPSHLIHPLILYRTPSSHTTTRHLHAPFAYFLTYDMDRHSRPIGGNPVGPENPLVIPSYDPLVIANDELERLRRENARLHVENEELTSKNTELLGHNSLMWIEIERLKKELAGEDDANFTLTPCYNLVQPVTSRRC